MSNKKDDLTQFVNPTTLSFPTDVYGMTKDLRKDMLTISSRIKGDEAKLQLLKDTLSLCMKHVMARFAEEKAAREKVAAE